MAAAPRFRDEQGITLVELLVVMVLFGVVGGVVTSAIVSSMRTTHVTNARIQATQELEIGLQRVTRDLRAADPLVLSETNEFADELGASILSDGERRTVNYRLVGDAGEQQFVRQDTGQALVALVDNGGQDVFTYLDRFGRKIDCTDDCDAEYLKTRQIEIRLVRELGDYEPIEVSTRVGVRNIRYGSTE